VRAVTLAGGGRIETGAFVNAAGPFVGEVGRLCGVELPVFCERHAKLAFRDTLGVVPRPAPLLIWADPQTLVWNDDERELLAEVEETRALLGRMPPGAHARPEGGHGSNIVLMLWAYDAHPVPPDWPPEFDPAFPEVVLRGLTPMVPGLHAYLGNTPRPMLDGGYYTKTAENRLLAGPLPLVGSYVLGAFSGYGLMAACGAAELLAAYLCGDPLPGYAPAFALSRYDDPAYQARLAAWGDSGQL
jgi:glycine/D-amino acid oxidase-like deaminating enzyme